MNEPPILDYGIRRRPHWLRLAVLLACVALLSASAYWGYTVKLRPWMEQLADRRQWEQELSQMLNYQPNTAFPVAAIVLEPVLQREPDKLSRMGQIPCYTQGRDSLGGGEFTRWQASSPPLWYNQCIRYYFQHGTNVFLGSRTASDGNRFLVALDVTIQGLFMEFHATAFDVRTQDLAEKVRAASAYRPQVLLADYSFVEDACYILPAQADPADPSAFTFTLIHGPHRDTITGRVRPAGTVDLTVHADPAAENRWRIKVGPPPGS